MNPIMKKLVLRASLTVSVLAVSALGMQTVYRRSQSPLPDSVPVSAQPDLVIVLDVNQLNPSRN